MDQTPIPSSAANDNARLWRSDLLKLGLGLLVFFLAFLGVRPLSNPDEGRYAEIPRQMLESDDYVTPRLNGVKYFEKPPLLYWLTAGAFAVGGTNEWAARFWCAAFAALGGLLTYAAGRFFFGRRAGWYAAIVLSTSLLYYALSRVLLLDLAVAVLMAGALFAFIAAQQLPAGRARWGLYLGFYGFMALATLTKGLIGFALTGLVAFVWVVVFNRWRSLWPFYPVSGIALFLAIAAPWHVLAARANPDFLHFYFVREHYLRFTTTLHDRAAPWWYFLPVLAAGLLPWVGFLPQAVRHAQRCAQSAEQKRIAWFLFLWVAVIFLFFSKSQSKLAPYIMPIFPAAAVLIGRYLAELTLSADGRGRLRAGVWTMAGCVTLLAIAVIAARVPSKYAYLAPVVAPWRIALGALLGSAAVVSIVCLLRQRPRAAMTAAAVGVTGFLMAANFLGGLLDSRSTRSLAQALLPQLRPTDAVYCVGEYIHDFNFYLARPISVVGYRGELEFGIEAEPALTRDRFLDVAAFGRRWTEGGVAYALVHRKYRQGFFEDANLPCTVVAETPRYALVTNKPK